jgi:hypothetical protein
LGEKLKSAGREKETKMKIRSVILSGAALALSVSGVLAQGDDYARYGGGPQYSTPAEMQQTEQLNAQALNGTTQSPAALNGETQTQSPSGSAGYGPDGTYQQASPYSNDAQYGGPPPVQNAPLDDENRGARDRQAQYEEQQQQYQQRMQSYGNQEQNYQNEQQRYAQDVRDYDLAQYAWSYPEHYVYRYGEESGLQPLYLIAEPSQQLWRVPVEGPGGLWVGRVRNVDIAPDGRPLRVEVALNRRVSVWVHPGDLRFDPTEGILYTDLSRDQLWEMPGATIESAPL